MKPAKSHYCDHVTTVYCRVKQLLKHETFCKMAFRKCQFSDCFRKGNMREVLISLIHVSCVASTQKLANVTLAMGIGFWNSPTSDS
jgi:hypothetical protein